MPGLHAPFSTAFAPIRLIAGLEEVKLRKLPHSRRVKPLPLLRRLGDPPQPESSTKHICPGLHLSNRFALL